MTKRIGFWNILSLVLARLTTASYSGSFGIPHRKSENNYDIKAMIPSDLKNKICLLGPGAVCIDKLKSVFPDDYDVVSMGRILKEMIRFKYTKLFSVDERCGTSQDEDIRKHLEALGLKKKNGELHKISINVKEIQNMILCKGILGDKKPSLRLTRSVDLNSNSTTCFSFWMGDGYCDLGCNTAEFNYDDGDCCYETCTKKVRMYPCGFTGFQCKEDLNGAPSWFKDIKFCFKWRENGVGGQCDMAYKGKICAPIGSMTRYYYDNTDDRNGGCRLSWQIEAKTAPSWFWTRLQLCLFTHSEGNQAQCNYGSTNKEYCRQSNRWLHYVDDTDDRPGGCFLSWKMRYLGKLPVYMKSLRFCFYWKSTGGQCGMPGQPKSNEYNCVPINNWTEDYRDGTDDRTNGCEMAWGMLL